MKPIPCYDDKVPGKGVGNMRLALLSILLTLCLPALAAEQVKIPSSKDTLRATLYRPAGNDPAPAIVALHGCGGLTSRNGHLHPQYEDWAARLTAAGFVVLFPDSYGSRGLGPQCRVQKRSVRPARERVADANAARLWLQSQPFVQADRVFLLGWSNGGSSTLWTVRPQAAPKDGSKDFRSAVAFYPGCRLPARAAWSARIPILVLIGAIDDWTPAADCDRMITGANGRSARTALIKYNGAYHSFDRANFPVREINGVAFSGSGTGRVHVGGNAEARADAIARVPEWFKR